MEPLYASGMNWLGYFLDEKKMSGSALARAIGTTRQTVSKIVNGKLDLDRDWAMKIAPILQIGPEELIFGPSEKQLPVSLVPVLGTVAAGLWFEHDDLSTDGFDPIPVIPMRFPAAKQFAFQVSGPSMDLRRIFNRDYVICVAYWTARRTPETGDIVVVERRDGHRTERTCKEIVVSNGIVELWPRSTDVRFKDPLHVPNSKEISVDDGMQIEIIGLVIGVYSPR
ncbi:MAG: XRE family transcriptional regulator [Methylocella sp.]